MVDPVKKSVTVEVSKLAAFVTIAVVLAVLGVTKFMETEEVLWMVLAIPAFAMIMAAV